MQPAAVIVVVACSHFSAADASSCCAKNKYRNDLLRKSVGIFSLAAEKLWWSKKWLRFYVTNRYGHSSKTEAKVTEKTGIYMTRAFT